MSTIAVVGPGAVGGVVVAWLADKPDFDMVACARTPITTLSVRTASGLIESRPRVLTDPSDATPVDWVMFAPKAYDTAGAAVWLTRLLHAETRVAVLQNGVEHVERLSAYVTAERILPCVVDFSSVRLEKGEIAMKRSGPLLLPQTPDGAAFVKLLAQAGFAASTVEDFPTVAWRKLTYNAAGAIQALTGRSAGIVQFPAAANLMRALAEECVEVGRAEGADLSDDLADEIVEETRSGPPDSINSLLADRLSGRPMEVDARNGAVVRKGLTHGVPTPANQIATWILSAMERAEG